MFETCIVYSSQTSRIHSVLFRRLLWVYPIRCAGRRCSVMSLDGFPFLKVRKQGELLCTEGWLLCKITTNPQ